MLDDAPRHVLARLLFVKGPWHPISGSRASVESYAGGDATAAMAALTRAGALVPLTEASPRADAAEALPALVGDEVKRVYMALKESAPDAWKAAKKQHKGSTKEVHVAVIRAVAAGLENATALSFFLALLWAVRALADFLLSHFNVLARLSTNPDVAELIAAIEDVSPVAVISTRDRSIEGVESLPGWALSGASVTPFDPDPAMPAIGAIRMTKSNCWKWGNMSGDFQHELAKQLLAADGSSGEPIKPV